MKIESVLSQALNESSIEGLQKWSEAAEAKGFKITKDNKTGTYHAWDGTTHKGTYRAGNKSGNLSESSLDEVMSPAARQRYIHAANKSRADATDEYMRTGKLDPKIVDKMGRRAERTMKLTNMQSKKESASKIPAIIEKYEARAKSAKNVATREQYTKMANDLRNKLLAD